MKPEAPVDQPSSGSLPLDARAVALTHLALRGARELNQLVAETHATIAQTPLPLPSEPSAPARQAPLAYKLVGHSFLLLARWARTLLHPERLAQLSTAEEGLAWQRFQGALNGVCGDTLVHWENPLAAGMSLRDARGRLLGEQAWPGQGRHAVLFIHGLCLTEREWQGQAHQAYAQELEAKGCAVAYLRYNSGTAIADNGRALDLLLRGLSQKGGPQLHLIGHSMGGLLIRAACHSAGADQAGWPRQMASAAYLGSPHLGSVWERLGDRANNLLNLTPYTRPFMRLGNIRSQGIRDLRHGYIGVDRQELLPATAAHLLLAGDLGTHEKSHLLGDGLVALDSALGLHRHSERCLRAPRLSRREVIGLGHMAMLKDERVYSVLREWQPF